MSFLLKINGVNMPAPVQITSSDELIWSSNTGRTSSGAMVGTLIAGKKTVDFEWGVLTAAQVDTICDAMSGDFFPLRLMENGTDTSITVYRGSIKKEHLGEVGDGTYYYKSLTASLIQR